MVAHRKGKVAKKGTDTPVRSTKPNRTEELLVETAIVSIMKREQKVSHADLFSMVSERLQKRDFTTTVSLFKNATRNLIEKEFIYREEEEKLYIYMV
ncbi:hypothetical protein AGDE_14752 [Angomonas deanei]|nr:hypothetical protein AGDE_14752 [Angomonas deanei]|eukprot:EPY20292.1 hypothetical protein AGDE_14752 [Angomonas deanei]